MEKKSTLLLMELATVRGRLSVGLENLLGNAGYWHSSEVLGVQAIGQDLWELL